MSSRVLVVSPYRNEYGPATVRDHVIQALIEAGHEPHLALPAGTPMSAYVREHRIAIHPIASLAPFPRTASPARLASFLRQHLAASGELARVAKRERIAIVYSASEAIICGGVAARRAGLSSIVHAIGMSIGSPRAVGTAYIALLDRLTDQFISCSSAVSEMFTSHGVSDEKVVVVHNGISVDSIESVERQPPDGESNQIGMVAAFDPRKGQELFLDAAEIVVQSHPQTTFVLIGGALPDNPESIAFEKRIRKTIIERGLEKNVVLTGWVPAPQVYRMMKNFTIAVVPSATEAFAHALLEAMACAKPVVATRIQGNLDALIEGQSGLFVDRDPRQLANALVSLLDNPSRAEALGIAGQHRVRALFDLAVTLPPIAAVVDGFVGRVRPIV
jgi:glycosyltransferase involved in cell wall biosynthesis